MKYTVILLLTFAASLPVSAQKDRAILVNTKWKFIGLAYSVKTELHPCDDNIGYTISFSSKNKLSGIATLPYRGKYKIKENNRIRIRAFIPKGVPAGVNDSREFECRIYYNKYLGMSSTFSIEGDRLKIFSGKYTTMLFDAVK